MVTTFAHLTLQHCALTTILEPDASSMLRSHSDSLLLVQFLGLVIQWGALFDDGKPFDLQCCPRSLASSNPGAGFGTGTPLLADNFPALVLHQIRLLEPTLSLCGFASEDVALGQPSH